MNGFVVQKKLVVRRKWFFFFVSLLRWNGENGACRGEVKKKIGLMVFVWKENELVRKN